MDFEATEYFANHIYESKFNQINKDTLEKAKIFLLDTIGVGIAGSTGSNLNELKTVVSSWSKGSGCTILGSGESVSLETAAIINAYQIHCLEYDCIHDKAIVHPMATIFSSLLSYCENKAINERAVNGKDFLLSLILGVDIASLLGICATGELRFFRPATASGFGAISALSKIENLNIEEIKNALGIMYSQTSGNMQAHVEGVPILGLQTGFNSRSALCAIDLAKAGFPGPKKVFNGIHGYFRLIENNQFNINPIIDELGKDWKINELSHKPYPSGRLTHGLVDAIKNLKNKNISKDQISSISCKVPPGVFKLVSRPIKSNLTTNYAKLCAAYVGASFFIHGYLSINTFTDKIFLEDIEVHELAKKISFEIDPIADEKSLTPQHFVITLKDKQVIEITIENVYGNPKNPMSKDEYIKKFDECCTNLVQPFSQTKIQQIKDFVFNIENEKDATSFLNIFKKAI